MQIDYRNRNHVVIGKPLHAIRASGMILFGFVFGTLGVVLLTGGVVAVDSATHSLISRVIAISIYACVLGGPLCFVIGLVELILKWRRRND